MIKLIDIKTWLAGIVLFSCGFLYILPDIKIFITEKLTFLVSMLPLLDSFRILSFLIATFLSLLFFRCVWRTLWKLPILGEYLSNKIFPDLNGHWDVEIQSNWPTINAIRIAAANSDVERIDVQCFPEKLPPNKISKFRGVLNQNWQKVTFIFETNEETPLRNSRTISFELLKATNEQPKRVAWIFRQENDEVAATDEDNFLGAAILEVEGSDKLSGKYWNNRSWRKGLNAAGEIVMYRR